jgi:hypothetical protein
VSQRRGDGGGTRRRGGASTRLETARTPRQSPRHLRRRRRTWRGESCGRHREKDGGLIVRTVQAQASAHVRACAAPRPTVGQAAVGARKKEKRKKNPQTRARASQHLLAASARGAFHDVGAGSGRSCHFNPVGVAARPGGARKSAAERGVRRGRAADTERARLAAADRALGAAGEARAGARRCVCARSAVGGGGGGGAARRAREAARLAARACGEGRRPAAAARGYPRRPRGRMTRARRRRWCGGVCWPVRGWRGALREPAALARNLRAPSETRARHSLRPPAPACLPALPARAGGARVSARQ